MARPAPRSLADDLRARSDEALAALVRGRPDLIHPVPADLGALALRAGSPASVATALRGYDQLHLHVLLAAALGPDPITPAALLRAVAPGGRLSGTGHGLPNGVASPTRSGALAELVRRAVDRLRTDALLWGGDRLHLVGAARDLLVPADRGPRIAALDPVVAGYAVAPGTLRALLESAPEGARSALDRLLAGPVVGTVVDARRTPDAQRSPIDWLLAHHLVVPMGADRVVVPAEVVALLRAPGRHPVGESVPMPGQSAPTLAESGSLPGQSGSLPGQSAPTLAESGSLPGQSGSLPGQPDPDQPLPVLSLLPPRPATGSAPTRPEIDVDARGVGAVLDMLHAVAELGEDWAAHPPARLRGGGVSQRDLTRTARTLGVSEGLASLAIEVARAAGLLAPDAREVVTVLPTPAFDQWLTRDPAARHAELLIAWRDLPRTAGVAVGDSRPRPLDPALANGHVARLRRAVLAVLAGGSGWTDDEVLDALAWHEPRRIDPGRTALAGSILAELRALGVLVSGTLSDAGQALLADDREAVEAALARVLPGQVDTLVMQADLTAVAPGLPTAELAALMRRAAEPESTGAASVYRFSEATIRSALDSGMTAAELLAELSRRGTVPQPLAYLIEDVARRHATLRIGAAATFLHCDDPVTLAALLADPRTAGLGLFRLADTVVASGQPAEHVLERLRELGHAPQPEPGRGPAVKGPRRARAQVADAAEPTGPPSVTPALAAAAVRALRASDRGSTGGSGVSEGAAGPRTSPPARTRTVRRQVDPEPHAGPVATMTPSQISDALRAAIAADEAVWIGYADPTGVATDRQVEPLRVVGGYLTALDLRTEAVSTFALARITGVEPA